MQHHHTTFSNNHKWRGLVDPARQFAKAFNTEKQIIAVDLDNTVRDQIGAIIDAVWLKYGVELCRADFHCWDAPLGERCGVSNLEWTAWAWGHPQIFEDAVPVEGAAYALGWLMRRYQVHIVTSTRWPQLTAPWLAKRQIPHNRVFHTADKGSVEWDYLIDDRPDVLEGLHRSGHKVVRFALPWNSHLAHLPTLENWSQVRRVFSRESDAMFWSGRVIPRSAFGI